MKKIIVLLGVGIMLFGCAHRQPPPQTFWVRPGSTEQEFNSDKYQCMKEVVAMFGQQGYTVYGSLEFVIISNQIARNRAEAAAKAMFEACMKSKGWTMQSNEVTKPKDSEVTMPSRSKGRRFVGEFPSSRQTGCYWILDRTNWEEGNIPPTDSWVWEEKCE